MVELKMYEPKYQNQIVALILYLQNFEGQADISIENQMDLLDIPNSYFKANGCFWVAVNKNDDVVGTIALMNYGGGYGIMKKFFVHEDYRGREVGVSHGLFELLLEYAKELELNRIVLDSSDKNKASHKFYSRKGFVEIDRKELEITYDFPDRNSLFFQLELKETTV